LCTVDFLGMAYTEVWHHVALYLQCHRTLYPRRKQTSYWWPWKSFVSFAYIFNTTDL